MGITLEQFIKESNAIEGIHRDVLTKEVVSAKHILDSRQVEVFDLKAFVLATERGAQLRNKRGLDVRVGNHIPPYGSPDVEDKLRLILEDMDGWAYSYKKSSAYYEHGRYETLHPFTDGNGRSGRMLWLRMMGGEKWLKEQHLDKNVFLHWWYYQSLDAARTEV